ncbi:MAG: hypothetical protein IPQ28_13460 [Sphingobacteriales bacterium]|nr:hypothetical protein [Sphingobacteriales bacterium]
MPTKTHMGTPTPTSKDSFIDFINQFHPATKPYKPVITPNEKSNKQTHQHPLKSNTLL